MLLWLILSAVSMDNALSQYPPSQYMIIMPSHCEMENLNEGGVTSGYVTPTSTDVVDVKLPLEELSGSEMPAENNFTGKFYLLYWEIIISGTLSCHSEELSWLNV